MNYASMVKKEGFKLTLEGVSTMLEELKRNKLGHEINYIRIPKEGLNCSIAEDEIDICASNEIRIFIGFTYGNFKRNSGLHKCFKDEDDESEEEPPTTKSIEFENIDPIDINNKKSEIIIKTHMTQYGKLKEMYPHYSTFENKNIICEYTNELLNVINGNIPVDFLFIHFSGMDENCKGTQSIQEGENTIWVIPVYDIKIAEGYVSIFYGEDYDKDVHNFLIETYFNSRAIFMQAFDHFEGYNYKLEYRNGRTDESICLKNKYLTYIRICIIFKDVPFFMIKFSIGGIRLDPVYIPMSYWDDPRHILFEISPHSIFYSYNSTELKLERVYDRREETIVTLNDLKTEMDCPNKQLSYCALFIDKTTLPIDSIEAGELMCIRETAIKVNNCQYLEKEAGYKCHYVDGKRKCLFYLSGKDWEGEWLGDLICAKRNRK